MRQPLTYATSQMVALIEGSACALSSDAARLAASGDALQTWKALRHEALGPPIRALNSSRLIELGRVAFARLRGRPACANPPISLPGTDAKRGNRALRAPCSRPAAPIGAARTVEPA